MNMTEAVEQFRVDHPEFADNLEALRVAEIAFAAYQRYQSEAQPVMAGVSLNWKVCAKCDGRGWINVITYPGTSNTSGAMNAHTEACPACNGTGGRFE